MTRRCRQLVYNSSPTHRVPQLGHQTWEESIPTERRYATKGAESAGAEDWGWFKVNGRGGKCVWCELGVNCDR
jgi:hypothetical protein